jgi:4-amino-4-deoxy-L-arabinose transferase-like glycosyltransferase
MPRRPPAVGPELEPRERAFAALALVFAMACLLWRLVAEPFDHGYVRYLGLAAEMLRSGDFVVPRLGTWVYLQKPPLFVWIVAAAGRILGLEASLVPHAPNLLALGLSVFWMLRLGTRLFGRRDAALAAALVLLTTFETFSLLREKRIDPLFAAFLLGAFERLHAAWCAQRDGRDAVAPMAAAGLWLALSALVKGPLAVAFFLAVALPLCAWTGAWRLLTGARGAAAVAVFCAIVAIWPVLLVERLGLGEARRLFAATALTTRKGGTFHYLLNLPGQMAPYTIFAPALVWAAWSGRRRLGEAPAGLRFVLVWFAALFGLLHLSPMKHSRYLLPAFAPLALLVVALFASLERPGPAPLDTAARRLRDVALRVGFALFGAAGAGALVAAPLLPEGGLAVGIAGALCAIGAWLGWQRIGPRGDEPGAERPDRPRDRLPELLLLSLVVAVAWSAYDGGRAERFAARSTLPAARSALARLRSGEPAILVDLGESQAIAVQVVAGRGLPSARDVTAAAAFVAAEGAKGADTVALVTRAERAGALIADPSFTVRSTASFELSGRPLVVLDASPRPSPPPTSPRPPD